MLRKTRLLSGEEILEYLNKFKKTSIEGWTSAEFNFFNELYDAINWSLTYVIYYNSQSKVIAIHKVLPQEELLCVRTIKTGTPNTPPRFFSFFSDIVYHYPEDDQIDKYYPEEDQIDNCATTANVMGETIEKMQQVLESAKISFEPMPITINQNGLLWICDDTITIDTDTAYKHTIKIEKEDKEMNTSNIINFDFGPVQSDCIRLSTYGLAVKNKEGVYVSYDPASKSLVNVDIFSFEGKKFLYKIPAAIDDIKVGDIVLHNKAVHYVIGLGDDLKTLKVIDPIAGERKEILLTKSPFGFDFAIKVVNLLAGAFDSAATSTNPFGNMWMMALMSDSGADKLLPLLMMNNGGNIDPMMMYCMMSKGDNDMMLPLLLMSQNKPHTCKCGGCCSDKEDND